MKAEFIKKVKNLIFLIAALMLLVSCTDGESWFTVNVKDYLQNYTATVTVADFEFNCDYETDKDDYINISSDTEKSIELYLQNPQLHILEVSYGFNDGCEKAVETDEYLASTGISSIKFTQSEESASIITMTFAEEFLKQMECGGLIAPIITIYDPDNAYTFKYNDFNSELDKITAEKRLYLKCNSAPQAVKNFTVLQATKTTPDADADTYVLAFNMPDMSGIHRDISKITILKGKVIEDKTGTKTGTDGTDIFTVTPKMTTEDNGISPSDKKFVTGSGFYKTLNPGGNGIDFMGYNEDRAVYYITDIPLKSKEEVPEGYPFTIILEDKNGLVSEATVSEYSKQLLQVTTEPADLSMLSVDEDGYARIKINAPEKDTEGSSVQDIFICYILSDYQGNIIKQGSYKDSATIPVTPGKRKIEAWAHKAGYVDSNPVKADLQIEGKVYVNPSYDGTEEDGGRNTPWKSLSKALDNAVGAGFGEAQIVLLGDVVLDSPIILSDSGKGAYNMPLILSSEGGQFQIKVSDSAPENMYAIELNGSSSLKLSGIKVSRISAGENAELTMNSGASADYVYISGKDASVIMNDGAEAEYVYVSGQDTKFIMNNGTKAGLIELNDNAVIYADITEEGTDAVAKVKAVSPAIKLTVIKTSSGEAVTQSLVNRFLLQNPGFFITLSENGEGMITIAGIEVKLPVTTQGYAVSLNGLGEKNTVAPGGIISVNSVKTGTSSDSTEIKPADLTLKLYLEDKEIASSASGSSSITIPEKLPDGKYTLEVSFTVNDLVQNAQLLINVKKAAGGEE